MAYPAIGLFIVLAQRGESIVRKGILVKLLIFLLLLFLIAGCERASQPQPDALLDASIQQIIADNNIKTAAVGVIEGGELVWAGQYGEQTLGVSASKDTQFDANWRPI